MTSLTLETVPCWSRAARQALPIQTSLPLLNLPYLIDSNVVPLMYLFIKLGLAHKKCDV